MLAFFSVTWVSLGFYWGRKNKTFADHALAGRNVGLSLASATAVATWITSNTTMLAPQFALQLGLWGMIAYSTAAIGLFLFAPLAARIRALMPSGYTSGDFIRLRYGRPTWLLFLGFSLFYSITWLCSMAMAGGILLESISAIPYKTGMTVILIVCVLYTVRGGLYAVIGTDFIQSLLILAGVVFVGFSVLSRIDLDRMHAHLMSESPLLLRIAFPAALIALFNNLLFGMGEVFHNNVWWSRAFAFRKGVGFRAFLLAGCIWLPVPIAAGFLALAAPAMGLAIPSPDMVGPLVLAQILGKVGATVAFLVIFSSLASSIDSLLAATADLIAEDVFGRWFFGGRQRQDRPIDLKQVAQTSTIGLGLLAWIICLPRPTDLASLLFLAGPLVGSMIWPIVAGLYWKRTSPLAAFLGMAGGSLSGLWSYFSIGWYSGALVATAVSMCIVLACSLAQKTSFDWKTLEEFDHV